MDPIDVPTLTPADYEAPASEAPAEDPAVADVAETPPPAEASAAPEAPVVEQSAEPAAPTIEALLKERLGVEDAAAFVEDLAQARTQHEAAQVQVQQESDLRARTADYLAQLQADVASGARTEADAKALFTERWQREAASLQAEADRRELEELRAERSVEQLRAEFPDAPLELIRSLQAKGVRGNDLKDVLATYSRSVETSRAATAQERQALAQQARGHAPGRGAAPATERKPIDFKDVRGLSFHECLALEYGKP